jgi:hypothetical protein
VTLINLSGHAIDKSLKRSECCLPGQLVQLQVPEHRACSCWLLSGERLCCLLGRSTVLMFAVFCQGGQIFDNAYCGGGDQNSGITDTSIPISAAAQKKIAAAIFMGDPRRVNGLSYNVGTCTAQGVSLSLKYQHHDLVVDLFLVRSSSCWLQVPIRKQHPVVLRCCRTSLLASSARTTNWFIGPVLLHW